MLIALDRQERGKGELSAIQEVERDYNAQVIAIVTLTDLISYLAEQPGQTENLARAQAYRDEYGFSISAKC